MVRKALIRRVCVNCGRRFQPKKKNQKYCNDECRKEYYSKHYFVKASVEKTCPNCGTVFTTSKPKRQTYCTPECREEARVKRMNALGASTAAERATFLGERMAAFERDEFKCTVCGRGVDDGAVLDTVEDGSKLVTVCTDCKVGKEAKGDRQAGTKQRVQRGAS